MSSSYPQSHPSSSIATAPATGVGVARDRAHTADDADAEVDAAGQESAVANVHQHQIDENRHIIDAAAAAVAAANHGLQALQAATTLPNQNQNQNQNQQPVQQQAQQQQSHHHSPYPTLHAANASHGPQYHAPPGAIISLQPKSQMPQKATRLRRACDLCSARKVKCDGSQPCKPCLDLNVECKFDRAMKRRGPPNKHAEAARNKRPRLEPSFGAPSIQQQLPPVNMSPNPQNAAEALVSIGGPRLADAAVLDGETIAPFGVLSLLVDDFFTYIHPLAPFPHEPTFRKQFMSRLDRTDPDFLALLASMIGCLVASFPRAARLHLKSQQSSSLFPRAITMIERCRNVALDARGPQFMNKEDVTVYDAATSYFLGLAAGYTMQWKLCRRFMTETLSFIREMGYHKPRDLGSSHPGAITYRGPSFDHVQDQLGKRIFWVMFLGVRSMSQLGAPHSEIILPPFTPSEPRPDYPVEVDDQYILSHQILGQPEGTVSLLTGFVRAIKVYETMNQLVTIELSYGLASIEWYQQRSILYNCLLDAKAAVDDMPPELYLDMESPSVGQVGSTNVFDDTPGYEYHPPAYPQPQPPTDIRRILDTNPVRRRQFQYEIQKANIYASQLATRSHFVERYLNLRDANRDKLAMAAQQANGYDLNGSGVADAYDEGKAVAAAAVHAAAQQDHALDETMAAERENIVKNLLVVITSLPQQNMEPNGASLINKIRQVASTLLNDAPDRKGPLAKKNEEYLARFLGILTRLEKTVPANAGLGVGVGMVGGNYHGSSSMTPQDEEDELRNWADLREHQLRFANQGGFLANL